MVKCVSRGCYIYLVHFENRILDLPQPTDESPADPARNKTRYRTGHMSHDLRQKGGGMRNIMLRPVTTIEIDTS